MNDNHHNSSGGSDHERAASDRLAGLDPAQAEKFTSREPFFTVENLWRRPSVMRGRLSLISDQTRRLDAIEARIEGWAPESRRQFLEEWERHMDALLDIRSAIVAEDSPGEQIINAYEATVLELRRALPSIRKLGLTMPRVPLETVR